jgi:hypothetical protein
MRTTSKKLTAKLNLMDNLIIWPEESTVFMVSCVIDLTVEWRRFWIEEAIDCLHFVSEGMGKNAP